MQTSKDDVKIVISSTVFFFVDVVISRYLITKTYYAKGFYYDILKSSKFVVKNVCDIAITKFSVITIRNIESKSFQDFVNFL